MEPFKYQLSSMENSMETISAKLGLNQIDSIGSKMMLMVNSSALESVYLIWYLTKDQNYQSN